MKMRINIGWDFFPRIVDKVFHFLKVVCDFMFVENISEVNKHKALVEMLDIFNENGNGPRACCFVIDDVDQVVTVHELSDQNS